MLCVIACITFTAVLLASPCKGATQSCHGSQSAFTLQLQWLQQGQFSGFIAAERLGYYHEECISVSMLNGGPNTESLQVLASGGADLGIGWLANGLSIVQNGESLVNVMQHFQRPGMKAVAKKVTGIETFSDWKGKRIGFWADFKEPILATLAKEGFSSGSDVVLVEQSFSPQSLVEDSVDSATLMVYNEYGQLLQEIKPGTNYLFQPTDFTMLNYNDAGTGLLEDGVWVREDWISQGNNTVGLVKFLKASVKGFLYCRKNPGECGRMFEESTEHNLWMVHQVNSLVWPAREGVGHMNRTLFEKSVSILQEYGLLNTEIEFDDAYTNLYIDAALEELEAEGIDVRATEWTENPNLRFCLDDQERRYVCDDPPFSPPRPMIGLIIGLVVVGIIALTSVIVPVMLLLVCCFSRKRRYSAPIVDYKEMLTGGVTMLVMNVADIGDLMRYDASLVEEAIKVYQDVVIDLLYRFNGKQVYFKKDQVELVFSKKMEALHFCLEIRAALLEADWPSSLLAHGSARIEYGKGGFLVFRGLRVRMAVHYGNPELDFDEATNQYALYGIDSRIAHHMIDYCESGEIVISQALRNTALENHASLDRPVLFHKGDISVGDKDIALYRVVDKKLASVHAFQDKRAI